MPAHIGAGIAALGVQNGHDYDRLLTETRCYLDAEGPGTVVG